MSELTDALSQLRELEAYRLELVRWVWELAKAAEPELARLATELWSGDQTGAAVWLCESRGDLSPAELIAAGRCDLVLQKIHRSIHGIYS